MNKIGVIKEFDKLSRIVIPKELRDRYGFEKEVEIIATEEGVLIRKPGCKLVKIQSSD